MDIDGDATIGDQTAPLSLSFEDDIIENLDMVFTTHFEARKVPLALFFEYQYVSLNPTIELGPVKAEIDFRDTMIELGADYAFSETATTRWEVIGGFRYTHQDIKIHVDIDLLPGMPGYKEGSQNGGDNWWHSFLGARVEHKFAEQWMVIARGDYGYAGSDNTASNGVVMLDYRFNNWGSTFAGYKVMDYDYDHGSGTNRYAYDATQYGPLMGLNIYW